MFSFDHPSPKYSTIAQFNGACLNYLEIVLHYLNYDDWATPEVGETVIELCLRLITDGDYPDYGPDICELNEDLKPEIQNNRNYWVRDMINTLLDNHGMQDDYRCFVFRERIEIVDSDSQCDNCSDWVTEYPSNLEQLGIRLSKHHCYCQPCVDQEVTRIQSIVRQRQAQIRVIRNLHLTGRV